MYGKSNMETYITICKIDSQREFAVWLRKLKQGLCINLEGWDGESFKREGIYVFLWLIHVEVWQKTAKFCIAIICQLKKKKELLNRTLATTASPSHQEAPQTSYPHPSEGRQNENHNHRKLTKLITWITGLSNSVKLWAMQCRATQEWQVMVESSDKTWPTGGNCRPLQHSCLENPVNGLKRQKDTALKMSSPGG